MDNQPLPPVSGPPADAEGSAPPPRQLAAGEGAAWWGESWRIFCAAPKSRAAIRSASSWVRVTASFSDIR